MRKRQIRKEASNWLEELQLKSWEPEILLSGIVLYGMFKTPDLLDKALIFFETNVFGPDSNLDLMVSFLKVGVYWLIGGLILHLISRGVWIGMVGLSYTFPKGINRERLKYKGRFSQRIDKIPGYNKFIITLEKISSSLFASSFLLFMAVIGVYTYLLITIVIPDYLFQNVLEIADDSIWETVFGIYVISAILIGFVAMADFVTIGALRRFKWFAKVYWPFYWVVSVLTLSRYYRAVYYGLVSNLNPYGIVLFLLVFCASSIFGFGSQSDSRYPGDSLSKIEFWSDTFTTSAFSGYYDDQNMERYSVRASIPSDIIDENVLRLFIPANVEYEDSIRSYAKRPEYKAQMDSLKGSEFRLQAVRNFFKIYLDDSLLHDLPMKFHYKSHTVQKGYLSYIDIADLDRGMHEISIKRPMDSTRLRVLAQIPFYRDINGAADFGAVKMEPVKPDDYLEIKSLIGK